MPLKFSRGELLPLGPRLLKARGWAAMSGVEIEGSVLSATDIWEAYKAVLSGQLTAQRAGLRKDRDEECRKLENKLLQLKAEYLTAPSRDRVHRIEEVRRECGALVQEEARAQFQASDRVYEEGNKACNLLLWLDKKEEGQRWVRGIPMAEMELRETPQAIAREFAKYLEWIYHSRATVDQGDLEALVGDHPAPLLYQDWVEALEEMITEGEVTAVMSQMNNGVMKPGAGDPVHVGKLLWLTSEWQKDLEDDQELSKETVLNNLDFGAITVAPDSDPVTGN
ncbi:hypothetical protein NDU88_005634 [Pleurodeles waltl]|uniref:Uncharacterized protein n=1 Tax=Pleurodeles waltl TaxID=8319 RepID=A0AAV7LQ30_PLEWA|nr:hypothetical protein NDU88_005634 [Pleurodeles waltl]